MTKRDNLESKILDALNGPVPALTGAALPAAGGIPPVNGKGNQRQNIQALKSFIATPEGLAALRSAFPGEWRSIEVELGKSGQVQRKPGSGSGTLVIAVPSGPKALPNFLGELQRRHAAQQHTAPELVNAADAAVKLLAALSFEPADEASRRTLARGFAESLVGLRTGGEVAKGVMDRLSRGAGADDRFLVRVSELCEPADSRPAGADGELAVVARQVLKELPLGARNTSAGKATDAARLAVDREIGGRQAPAGSGALPAEASVRIAVIAASVADKAHVAAADAVVSRLEDSRHETLVTEASGALGLADRDAFVRVHDAMRDRRDLLKRYQGLLGTQSQDAPVEMISITGGVADRPWLVRHEAILKRAGELGERCEEYRSRGETLVQAEERAQNAVVSVLELLQRQPVPAADIAPRAYELCDALGVVLHRAGPETREFILALTSPLAETDAHGHPSPTPGLYMSILDYAMRYEAKPDERAMLASDRLDSIHNFAQGALAGLFLRNMREHERAVAAGDFDAGERTLARMSDLTLVARCPLFGEQNPMMLAMSVDVCRRSFTYLEARLVHEAETGDIDRFAADYLDMKGLHAGLHEDASREYFASNMARAEEQVAKLFEKVAARGGELNENGDVIGEIELSYKLDEANRMFGREGVPGGALRKEAMELLEEFARVTIVEPMAKMGASRDARQGSRRRIVEHEKGELREAVTQVAFLDVLCESWEKLEGSSQCMDFAAFRDRVAEWKRCVGRGCWAAPHTVHEFVRDLDSSVSQLGGTLGQMTVPFQSPEIRKKVARRLSDADEQLAGLAQCGALPSGADRDVVRLRRELDPALAKARSLHVFGA